MTRVLTTMLVLLIAATAGAQADHLQCFKIRDSIPKASYTANLTTAVKASDGVALASAYQRETDHHTKRPPI